MSADAEPLRTNVITLSATASEEVTQDLLTVHLIVNKDGTDATKVQTALKQTLQRALDEAKASAKPKAMEVRTGSFSVYPRYGNNGKIQGWQGSAELILEGTDTALVSQTAGKLDDLVITQTSYSISRDLQQKHEQSITAQAIAKFGDKALFMAKAFGFGNYQLGEVNVQTADGGGNYPAPTMMKASMRSEMASDAAMPTEPGKGQISATVSGSVILGR